MKSPVSRNKRQETESPDTTVQPLALCTTPTAIESGDTVALQSFRKSHWFSCFGAHCHSATCPGVIISGSDWTNCFGEVFQIYRAAGPGAVQVGDLVGLHYPRQPGHWLGCPGNQCDKRTCPGSPTTAHGFSSDEKWYICCGEVFKIYAEEKNVGDTINTGDSIMMYFLSGALWVSQGTGNTMKASCPGTSRPPPLTKYDRCPQEGFTIMKP